jgi:transcriptional regulator PpsR
MDLPPPPSPGPLPFRDPQDSLAGLETEATARILASTNDVTIVIDREGVIRDIAVGSTELGDDPFANWIDRPFIDTVSPESRHKVQEMLQDVASRGTPRWRQVNHPATRGQVPVRYLAMEAGSDGRVIAVGREMRAALQVQQRLIQLQQSMERDYVRLRETEQRYRLLFDQSNEAVLIVDGQSRRITEANPAAIGLLGPSLSGTGGGSTLGGQALPPLFAADDRDALLQHLGALLSGVQAGTARIFHLADGRPVSLAATLFRQQRTTLLLVRLLSDTPVEQPRQETPLEVVLDRIPDAFVLVDKGGAMRAVNSAFLDLTGLPRTDQVIGEAFSRFLARPDIDYDLMIGQLRTDGMLRNFETRLRTRHGELEDVEISAVSVERDGETHTGFVIRSIARRLGRADEDSADTPRSVEQLTELVGRVALKDIVRESTDLIERLCIEAALRYTSNNRASAAEILGLSRQSLYSKLHRHGLAAPGADHDD